MACSDRRGGHDCNDLPQLNPRIDVAEGRGYASRSYQKVTTACQGSGKSGKRDLPAAD